MSVSIEQHGRITVIAIDRAQARTNLIGLPRAELEAYFAELGEKPFRARQLMRWLYERGEVDWDAMTDLSMKLRERLAAEVSLELPQVGVDCRACTSR